jgi:hypothetical protein
MSRLRRFPPPWTAEVMPNCFIVRDANGQALSYIYYESEAGRRAAAKLLSKDEARRIAANIAARRSYQRRLAMDVKDVAGHVHRHQDHHSAADFHGSHLHGLSIDLDRHKTGIPSRAARHRRVAACRGTILRE